MEDIRRYPAHMLKTYNMTDCTLYQENRGKEEWLGFVIKLEGLNYIVFARYDVNECDELALNHAHGWTVQRDGVELATSLPSLREVFVLLNLTNKEEDTQ